MRARLLAMAVLASVMTAAHAGDMENLRQRAAGLLGPAEEALKSAEKNPPAALTGVLWGKDPRFHPPEILYHFGSRDNLLEDAKTRSVPEAAWKRAIMGEDGLNGGAYRRGLYGCSHPSWCESFTDGRAPWFIAIRLKPECRKPQAVAVAWKLPEDPRFQSWLRGAGLKDFPSLPDFREACWRSLLSRGEDGPCEKAIARFFREARIRVVFDEGMPDAENLDRSYVYPNSWYIRDRDCIAEILGSPEEELSMMADPRFWENPAAEAGIVQRPAGAFFRIILEALAGAQEVDPTVLEGLRLNTREAEGASRDFHLPFQFAPPGGLAEGTAVAADSYERCRKRNSLKLFRDSLESFLRRARRDNYWAENDRAAADFFAKLRSICQAD